ncbi:hypothetical protein EML15_07560 [Corynebacterium sp. sy017]|uniref:hypothetical protein n=1 Tax=unclassified Corynebacterium TaxID=2624378 RepID=UPI0011861A66|nr:MULTISPECIES: hypothetical protein [unclassified Corynebacterium]MBP3088999.1 hypothetical protein [Corynebacterium sp. sy017]TSD91321.1 hypothetical protein ELY17_07570 [Corynebacterium sp. SY003]
MAHKLHKSRKPIITIFLYFVVALLSLSAVCLIYSIANFQSYADAFAATHPDSFHNIDDKTITHRIVFAALVLRFLAALGWVGSFLYLKRFLLHHEKYRTLVMMGYSIVSVGGFIYLSFHAELHIIAIIRVIQVAISLLMLSFLIISVIKET